MKKYALFLALVLMFSLVSATTPTAPSTGSSEIQEEADWIMSAQLDNGAVVMTPRGTTVMPYFSNLALTSVLETTRVHDKEIKNYIKWYLENFNKKTDAFGIKGTMYDYKLKNKQLTSTNDYDSSDAYAGTFLMLVKTYYEKTGDKKFIRSNLGDLKKIASAIDSTMQTDGLTYAKPDYKVKYLMDNVEVWRGLQDFSSMLKSIGDKDYKIYQKKADKLRKSIEAQMWDPVKQEYRYYAEAKTTKWERFYPDATAALWPIIFDLPEARGREKILIDKFLKAQPKWITNEVNEYPWTSVAYALAKSGYIKEVKEFDANVQNKFFPDKKYPWYITESGWRIEYLKELAK